jgi:hypothetical protein
MYRCPHCKNLSISALSQLSPPFNGVTTCPACKSEVKVKRKFTNFLVAIYFVASIIASKFFGLREFVSSFNGLAILIAGAFFQIRFVEYEEIVPEPS